MQRRFGPTRGAGTVVIEKESDKQIRQGALGTTAFTGVMKKGPIGKMFRAKSKTEFLKKAGGVITESLLADSALSFYKEYDGSGAVWLNRLTDGTEKKSVATMFNRLSTGTLVAQFEAGNGGRWGGRKEHIVDEYASVTPTTLTLGTVPDGLKEDQLAGALLKLKAVPGQSFEVLSNSDAGVLQFAGDIDLVEAIDGSTNLLHEVVLSNDGESLAVLIKDGLLNPSTEFGLEFYLIEGNVSSLEKSFDDLSIDPTADNYFVDVINADSDSDFLIKASDLNIGGSKVAGQRPANYSSTIETLTAVDLTAKIHFLVVSSVASGKASLSSVAVGSEMIEDEITLTNTAAGARSTSVLTFAGIPADAETEVINGTTYTYKTVPVAATDVLIGASAEATLDNLVAVIAAQSGEAYFAEKASASTMDVFAKNAGVAGDAITTVSGSAQTSYTGAVLAGGVDQTWSVAYKNMAFVTGATATTGVALAAPNDFGYGFTLDDASLSSTKFFAIGDTVKVIAQPFEKDSMVGGFVFPDESNSRKKFQIISNDANKITVKDGSDMTLVSSAGETFRSQFVEQLAAGYDGLVGIDDTTYEAAYEPSTSPLKALRGKNLGLVKLATPGITSSAVQKAGVNFAESQNWQYRYEVPATITDEVDAEEYINATLGRNDFAVVSWPSYYKISKAGGGLKLVSATGGILGVEARIARDYDGYHKAGAGTDAKISEALALPDGMGEDREPLDEEFLNPQGINILKFKDGNLILWGDRTVGIDPAFTFKHQREYLSHIENVFLENFDFIIFALNSAESGTDALLYAAFISFFTPELAKGAIVGTNVVDATQLKIDKENNTDATRQAGDLFADMSIRIVDTVERFIIRVNKRGVTEEAA